MIKKFAEKKLPFQHFSINRAGITALNAAKHMQLIGQKYDLCLSSTRVTAVFKASLHNVNRHIKRCILMVYYITNQNSRLVIT